MIESKVTCDFCGTSESTREETSVAKKLWRETGWRLDPDGVSFCCHCVAMAANMQPGEGCDGAAASPAEDEPRILRLMPRS